MALAIQVKTQNIKKFKLIYNTIALYTAFLNSTKITKVHIVTSPYFLPFYNNSLNY